MTPSQFTIFKNAVVSSMDPVVAAARDSGNDRALSNYYNQPADPQVLVWIPNVQVEKILSGVVWSEFAGLLIGKQNTFIALTQAGSVDASEPRIRQAFVEIFGVGSQSLTHITALSRRPATFFESLFTTSGVCSAFGEGVTYEDCRRART